ncbi:MAG TPA: sugar ABC transporter permease [Clostridia bacterium]|nr:sugar ABC transporter permease [Clostridia bacterium]
MEADRGRGKIQKLWAETKKNGFLVWTLLPGFLYITAFFVIIAFFLLKLSLTEYRGGMVENSATIANYLKLVQSEEFRSAFLRTFIFVLFVTPLQLLTGLLAAILINRTFIGRGIVRGIFLLPLAIPTVVTTAVLLLMFSKGGHMTSLLMGEYNWFPGIVDYEIAFLSKEPLALGLSMLGKVWRDTPISMLILLAGLQSINNDQYEAARTMGSSSIQNFFFITLPLLIPAISSVLVLRSIEAWKEFIFPYILAPSYPVLGVLIEKYYVQLFDPGTAAAIGIMLIVVIMLGTVSLNWLLKKMQSFLVKV